MVEAWVVFSFISVLGYAAANIFDKYIVSQWVRNPLVIFAFTGIVSMAASILIFLFYGIQSISLELMAVSAIVGALYIVASVFYFWSIQSEEISTVVPILNLTPVFVAMLAVLFLGERLTGYQYVGIGLMVVGAIVISSKNYKASFGKPVWLALISSVVFSIYFILLKYLLDAADFWSVFYYTRIGVVLSCIPIAWANVQDLRKDVEKKGKRVLGIMSMSETLVIVSLLISTFAIADASVTLTRALAATRPFFILAIAIILTQWFGQILKEDIAQATVIRKLLAIALMFVGTLLII